MIRIVRAECENSGCEWLHVDFGDQNRRFYLEACGFTATSAGLIQLNPM
jgi:hypothetical protein